MGSAYSEQQMKLLKSPYGQNCKIVHNRRMKRLPLNVQTLYADLAQSVSFSATLPASIYKQTVGGKVYLYAVEKHGAARVKRYLGPASDPGVEKRGDDIRRAPADAKVLSQRAHLKLQEQWLWLLVQAGHARGSR
jgi:hypothetical protein